MYKSRVLIPVFAGAAALGVVAYALSRPSRRIAAAPSSPVITQAGLRDSMVVPRADFERGAHADLDLDGIFDANPEDALEHATVRADARVPALASADDAEPPSPEDLGAYWLARATESERSRDESDLELELDGLAIPDESADPEEEESEDDEASVLPGGSRLG